MFPIFTPRLSSDGSSRHDLLGSKKKKNNPVIASVEGAKNAIFGWVSSHPAYRPYFDRIKPMKAPGIGKSDSQTIRVETNSLLPFGRAAYRDASMATATLQILLQQRSSRNLLPDVPLHFWLCRELGKPQFKKIQLSGDRSIVVPEYTMPGPVMDRDLEIGSDTAMGLGQWHFGTFVETLRHLGAPMGPSASRFSTDPDSPSFREKNDYWRFFTVLDLLPFSYQYFLALGLVTMARKSANVITTIGSYHRYHPTDSGKGVAKKDFYFWQAFAPEHQVLKYTIDSPVASTTFRKQVDTAFGYLSDYYDFSPHKNGVSVLMDPYLSGGIANSALPLVQQHREQFSNLGPSDVSALFALISRDYGFDFSADVARYNSDQDESFYLSQLIPIVTSAISRIPVYNVGSLGSTLSAQAIPLGFSLGFKSESDEVSRQKSLDDTVIKN